MKRLNLILLFISMVFISASIGCKKDVDKFVPNPIVEPIDTVVTLPPPPKGKIADFFSNNLSQCIQTFCFDAGSPYMLMGEDGSRVNFTANSLVDQNDQTVTGEVCAEYIEVLNAGDMIWTGMPTMSGGQMLASGGEIFLRVTQNGEELKPAPGAWITGVIPAEDPTWEMDLFFGEEIGDQVDWIPADTAGQTNSNIWITESQDSSGVWGLGYEFIIDRFSWINCDYFYGQDNLTDINVIVPEGFDAENTAVFVVFNDLLSVIQAWGYEDGIFTIGSVPIGENITIVGIAELVEDEYYSSFTVTDITDMLQVEIEFNSTTLEQLETDLGSL